VAAASGAIKSFRFAWVEEQCHARGWVPNPRYPEREWLAIPALLFDRSYSYVGVFDGQIGTTRLTWRGRSTGENPHSSWKNDTIHQVGRRSFGSSRSGISS
jgi:hypothetical protein